jgi:hypothetical protein
VNAHFGLLYRDKAKLFSGYELAFLRTLEQFLGPEYRIFSKVHVLEVARLQSGLEESARRAEVERMGREYFHFIVWRTDSASVVCAIELSDPSVATPEARQRGEYLAELCHFVSLPFLRYAPRSGYALELVREQVLAAIASAPKEWDPSEMLGGM